MKGQTHRKVGAESNGSFIQESRTAVGDQRQGHFGQSGFFCFWRLETAQDKGSTLDEWVGKWTVRLLIILDSILPIAFREFGLTVRAVVVFVECLSYDGLNQTRIRWLEGEK
jgi:hypothetical protein